MPPTEYIHHGSLLHPADGLLAEMIASWTKQGWDQATLDSFVMKDGDDADGDDSGEDGDQGDGSDSDADGEDGDDDGDDSGGSDDVARLVRTLDSERTQRKAISKELRPWKALAREFGVTLDQAREVLAKAKATKPKDGDGGPSEEEIRRTATEAADRRANERVIRSEVKALAADLFANPADAALYLDLASYEVGADGDVDADEILDDLKSVLEDRPHLAKRPKRRPKPDTGQGAGNDDKASAQDRATARVERLRKRGLIKT